MKLFLKFLLLLCSSYSIAQGVQLIDESKYKWMHPEVNAVQFFDRSAIEHFYESWLSTNVKKMVIVDLGDSHLQAEIYPGQLRKLLQEGLGDGGKGMMFNYSAAKTYSSVFYATSHTGNWDYGKSLIVPPKVPLGVAGMACRTYNVNATLTFRFTDTVPSNYRILKLFIDKREDSYDIDVEAGEQAQLVVVDSFLNDSLPYIQVKIPPVNRTITLRAVRHSSIQNRLEFYGMSLETGEDSGVILHNGGVGGARYQSILYEEKFGEQLASLHPDLVIIDFGTNDYLYDDAIRPELDSEIVEVIKRVRNAAPTSSIMLTSTMSMYRKGIEVKSGPVFSEMMNRIAREQNCAFYDWYWVAGGKRAMHNFVDSSLGQRDMIHLTWPGYRLKGQLMFEAMERTIDFMESDKTANAFIMNIDSLKAADAADTTVDTIQAIADKYNKPQYKWKSYKKNGKTYYYKVPLNEAARLEMQRAASRYHSTTTTTTHSGTTTTNGKSKVHVVQPGESLYKIAYKYGTTVDAIKRANGLRSDMIHPNQQLVIPGK